MRVIVRYISLAASCLLLLLSSGCSNKKVNHGFYYWRSTFALSSNEQQMLNNSSASKIFIKYFDVVSDDRFALPIPTATISFAKRHLPNKEIIPVVYVTTSAILKLNDSASVATLAKLICQRIHQIDSVWNVPPHREIQIDCDWTPKTRKSYFALLRQIKANKLLKAKTLSATIRLHQIKYPEETGVPPVDRGMLMCYNLTDVRSSFSTNSIFSADEATRYTQNLDKYPIDIDIALPIFSWGVVFNNNRFRIIINGLTFKELSNNSNLAHIGRSWFKVTKPTVIEGVSLSKGDKIRVEESDINEVKRFGRKLSIANSTVTVSLFSIDSKYIKTLKNEDIEALFSAVH